MRLPDVVVFRAEAGPDCPFWTVDGVGLDCTFFPSLASELVSALVSWCKQSWEIEDGTEDEARWVAEGRRLHASVAESLPPGVELRWEDDN